MRFDAVMFDLDGTLADTLADIAAAGNHVLTHYERPTIDVAQYRLIVGQGTEYLLARALGPGHEANVAEGVGLFRAYYAERGLEFARPYDGVPALLDDLKRIGLPMAVLSNKADASTRQVVNHLFGGDLFDAARGHATGPDALPLKPDPAAALSIADELGVPYRRWVYVGDTGVDMQTARAAGMFAVGVLWGFRDEPELRDAGAQRIIRHPRELLELITTDGKEEA